MDFNPKQRISRLLLYFFACALLLGLITFAFFAVSYRLKALEYEQAVLLNGQYTVSSQRNSMTEILNDVLADLLYLADGYEAHFSLHESFDLLAADLLAFCRRKKIYDQIRIIDLDGNESLRINYNDGDPAIVPPEGLQDKSERYYFHEAVALDAYSFYLSPIDLNIENGEVEVPYKPMLRIAKPLYVDGEEVGVIVLNFLAERFLDQPYLYGPGDFAGSRMILNSDSHILRHDAEPGLEFRFMLADEQAVRFHDLYPEEAEAVYGASAGTLRTEEGLFVWQTVKPITDILTGEPDVRFASFLVSSDQYFWKLVVVADQQSFATALGKIRGGYARRYRATLGPILVLAALAAWLVNRNREYRLQIRRMARYDVLTNLPNRQFLTILGEKQLALAERQNSIVGILFLDLDGFKPVNDTYGHAVGDRILQTMANRIRSAVRASDFAFRIGGDEFVVILQDLHERDNARAVGEKIVEAVNRPIEMRGDTISLGVSIGGSVYPEDEKSLDLLIRLADEAMYRAKNDGRNRIVLHDVSRAPATPV